MLDRPVIRWIFVATYENRRQSPDPTGQTETDAYLSRLHGLRTKLHPHPGMAEDP